MAYITLFDDGTYMVRDEGRASTSCVTLYMNLDQKQPITFGGPTKEQTLARIRAFMLACPENMPTLSVGPPSPLGSALDGTMALIDFEELSTSDPESYDPWRVEYSDSGRGYVNDSGELIPMVDLFLSKVADVMDIDAIYWSAYHDDGESEVGYAIKQDEKGKWYVAERK